MINLTITIFMGITTLIVPNAQSWCAGGTLACYLPEPNLIVMSESIKPEFVPFILLHEYGHSKGMGEVESSNYAKGMLKVLNNPKWKIIDESLL